LVGFKNLPKKKDLACHGFDYYLVGDKNLLTSHIWLAKYMAMILPSFGLPDFWHGKF
jgi:hypothetical protein